MSTSSVGSSLDETLAVSPGEPSTTAIHVLHCDEGVVAICKPAGLLSVPGRGPQRQDCAASRVQALFPDARVVHRLDMGTSGLMVFARGLQAQRTLSLAFEQRRVHKSYVAVVAGAPDREEGRVELPLIVDWLHRPRQRVDCHRGRHALTRWRRIGPAGAPWPGATRLALHPLTGRSHQLRLHMASIGHPILGDELYAPEAVRAAAARLLLHASELEFPHPLRGTLLRLQSAEPF